MPQQTINTKTKFKKQFTYDLNGNLTGHLKPGGSDELYWDEQDRMKAFYNTTTGSYQYNVFDEAGERAIKYTLNAPSQLYQNGQVVDPGTFTIADVKVYPNAYQVITANGTTSKHYYAGSQRIASRVEQGSPIMRSQALKDSTSQTAEADFANVAAKAGFESTEVATAATAETNFNSDLYFLHSDHLGTGTFVTNNSGTTTQFFLSLPFGETMAEQNQPGDYNNPYKFNAKKLDEETGLYYYGARFYDPRVSMWVSVDPLAEKMISWSPYNYTFNNPINLIDPDGMAPRYPPIMWMLNLDKDKIIYEGAKEIGKNDKAIHIVAHGNEQFMRHVENGKKGEKLDSPKKFDRALSKVSLEWKNRKKGEILTVILRACNTGNGLAQKLSEAFQDVIFVAPNQQVYWANSGEQGPYETVTTTKDGKTVNTKGEAGTWQVFKGGKTIAIFGADWKPKSVIIIGDKKGKNKEQKDDI